MSSVIELLKNCCSYIIPALQAVPKFALVSTIFFILYRQLPHKIKAKLHFLPTEKNDQISQFLKTISYRPTFYLPHHILQLGYHEYKSYPDLKYFREYFQNEDKGLFSMDWLIDEHHIKKDKLLILLHGLTGGSEAGYLREMIDEFNKLHKYKIVVIHNRGINDTPLFTPYSFHAAWTKDIELALNIINSKYPNTPIYCAGVSMGANIFTKLLGKEQIETNLTPECYAQLKSFVSVSNPLNLSAGERRNRNTFIDFALRDGLIKYINQHSILRYHSELKFDHLHTFKNTKDIESEFTVKIHKFKDLEDYYTQTSSIKDLEKIKIPSLFINAKDDSLAPTEEIDLEIFEKKNGNIMLLLTDVGSHVCWFEGTISPKRWFIGKMIKYFEAVDKYW
jgi:predicted alpha/beta-fold hydrolase